MEDSNEVKIVRLEDRVANLEKKWSTVQRAFVWALTTILGAILVALGNVLFNNIVK